ncbi:MAG: hypothetical protein ACKOBM_10965 [Gammaproteobacteria bacterium]
MTRWRAVAVALLVATASPTPAAEGGTSLAGAWILNDALTRELNPPEQRSNSTFGGFSAPTVVVGGMPVPLPGSGGPSPGIGGASPDPQVLRTQSVVLTPAGDEMVIDCVGVGVERLKRGNNKGQKSRWDARELQTGYETTTREVSQTWRIDDDGRLRVLVKLDPKQGRTQKHWRVFDRAAP